MPAAKTGAPMNGANHSLRRSISWFVTSALSTADFRFLKEAEVIESGKRLGPVGGRIVAEVRG